MNELLICCHKFECESCVNRYKCFTLARIHVNVSELNIHTSIPLSGINERKLDFCTEDKFVHDDEAIAYHIYLAINNNIEDVGFYQLTAYDYSTIGKTKYTFIGRYLV